MDFEYDLCIVGGFGYVCLPMPIAFASKGFKVCAFDTSKDTYGVVSKGKIQFIGKGAEHVLNKAPKSDRLRLSLSPKFITKELYFYGNGDGI